MSDFHFYIPVSIRYSDLDPQWHVNNARILSFMEQARFAYLIELNLWDGESFFDLGLIVADAHVSYLAPILHTQNVRVGARVSRIGNKSLDFEYLIEEVGTGQVFARGETVMVAYDYHTHKTIPVSYGWRAKIGAYEGRDFSKTA